MNIELNPKTCLAIVVGLLASAGATAQADYVFGTATNLGPTVNSSVIEGAPSLSADGLSLYFDGRRSGGFGSNDIWVTTRPTISDPWGTPVNLGSLVNGPTSDWGPDISSDGLKLYFGSSDRPGVGRADLWVASRQTLSDPWGEPVNLGPTVNSIYTDAHASIAGDGLELYFSSNYTGSPRPGGFGDSDIWVTTRATTDDPWGSPENLGPTVNSSSYDAEPDISADGLMLFFNSGRPGGSGSHDIWVTTRASKSHPWTEPANLGPAVNSSSPDPTPAVAHDGSAIFFMSNRPGGRGDFDIWQTSLSPVVDLNGDMIVDVKDVVIVTEHWGENYSLCDIGPTPFGDGIVDIHDLEVLTQYIEPIDRTFIAHWALDEIEGDIAYDTAGPNDAFVIGGALWQPSGGQIEGAIQLDGLDDVVIADPTLNPADGPFSVLAWIKGGAPGQAVISQQGGVNWLGTDPLEGYLMTELTGPGRSGSPLLSQTAITDGQWHRIGFVWDGLYRTLYVDGVAVAQDTQNNLESSSNGLYIGAGNDMQAGTFFSGLIDDVRIYNRTVRP